MKEFKYVIKDEQGIHARPAGLFVKEAAAFPCKVIIEKDGKEADAKRIFAAIGLADKCGSTQDIRMVIGQMAKTKKRQ